MPLAHDLATRLPRTRRALAGGVIDAYKAQLIAEATRVLDDAGAAAEAEVVPAAVAGKPPGQVRVVIARAVLKAGPGAARRRREEAEKDPRVERWREEAGTAALCGYGLPPDAALAAGQAIGTAAAVLKKATPPPTAAPAPTAVANPGTGNVPAASHPDTAPDRRAPSAGHPADTGPGGYAHPAAKPT